MEPFLNMLGFTATKSRKRSDRSDRLFFGNVFLKYQIRILVVFLIITIITMFFTIFSTFINSKNQKFLEKQDNVIVKKIEFHPEISTKRRMHSGNGALVPQCSHFGTYWEIVVESKIDGKPILVSASYNLEKKPNFQAGDKISVRGKELKKVK